MRDQDCGGTDVGGIVSVVESLVKVDPAVLDRGEIDQALVLLRRVRGWVDAGVLGCTRRLNELSRRDAGPDCSGTGAGGSVSANQALIDSAGQSSRDAAATQERVELCSLDHGMEDSLAAGEVTSAHLDVIARFARQLDGAARAEFESRLGEFRQLASGLTVAGFEVRLKALVRELRVRHRPVTAEEELERQRAASSVKHWVDSDSGLHKFLLSMDPVRAAKFRTAWRAQLNTLLSGDTNRGVPYGSLQVDAIIGAMTASDTTSNSTRVPELVVHVDAETLLNGEHIDSLCETDDGDPIPVSLIRQMVTDATIHFVNVDRHGAVLDSIDARIANRQQRRALSAMHRTCCFPDCTIPVTECRTHHVRWVSHGGATRLGNLIPVCEAHHHAIHDHGWRCELNETNRAVSWTPPHEGRPRHVQPNRHRPQRRSATTEPTAGAPPGPTHANQLFDPVATS